MDPLSIIALTVSVGSFAVDILLVYRQFHVKPWKGTEPDLEASKEESQLEESELQPSQEASAHHPSPAAAAVDESTPLLEDRADTALLPATDNEKSVNDDDNVYHHPAPSTSARSTIEAPTTTVFPPPDAPRWLFGLKRSQRFLSPAERPPIFSRWYHVFKILWPALIVQGFLVPRPNPNYREPHPQASLSGILCASTMGMKLALGLMFFVPLGGVESDIKLSDSGLNSWTLLEAEAWGLVVYVFCSKMLYWRSRGKEMVARLRVLVFAAATVALIMAVWSGRGWSWSKFGFVGLPFAVIVGLSYGIAWERWV